MQSRQSIIRNNLNASLLFGLCIGIIFPFFAAIFVTPKSPSAWIIFIIACLIAGLIVGLFSFFILKLTVLRVLKSVLREIHDINHNGGNLETKITIKSNDLIGRLIDEVNLFIHNAHNIVQNSKTDLYRIQNSEQNIEQKISNSLHSVNDIETSLYETQAIVKESNKIMQSVKKNVEAVEQNLSQVKRSELAIENKKQISLEKIQQIKEDIASFSEQNEANNQIFINLQKLIVESQEKISTLYQSEQNMENKSKEIVAFIAIIQDIADKTHILAINASLEAANAGEAGKGFTVISKEIRQLAHNSTNESKRISLILQEFFSILKINRDSSQYISSTFEELQKSFQNFHKQTIAQRQSIQKLTEEGNELTNSTADLDHSIKYLTDANHAIKTNLDTMLHQNDLDATLKDDIKLKTINSLNFKNKIVKNITETKAQFMLNYLEIRSSTAKISYYKTSKTSLSAATMYPKNIFDESDKEAQFAQDLFALLIRINLYLSTEASYNSQQMQLFQKELHTLVYQMSSTIKNGAHDLKKWLATTSLESIEDITPDEFTTLSFQLASWLFERNLI